MSTQQDIYAAGSESRPPMLNKENYVPWSSRLLRYAKSRPKIKLIHNSIINGPYVKRMIPEPDDELTKKELKQIEADDQAIQTILLGLPEDIYAAVDSYETAQEIWLRVQQMMKGSDIGIQEKKAKLFNEWERFTSNEGESIESYYHRELKAERLTKTQDPLALMANSNNPYNFPAPHQDQPSFNQNYMQQPMPNHEDITDPTTAMNMALTLMAKAFKLNYSTPTNNNQRISSNPRNRQIAQPGMNMGQDRKMQMVRGNGENQFRQYVGQNVGNLNRYNAVQNVKNQNLNRNGNLVAARTEGNAAGHNGNHIRCYNCRGVGHFAKNCTVRPRRRDAAYLQTQLLIAQNEEAGIQLQAEEFDLMAAADLDEIKEVNANCILMANLQQASTSGTQTDKAPVYDSDGSAKNDNDVISEVNSVEQSGETVEQNPVNFEETHLNKQLSKEKSTISFLLEEKKKLKSDFKTREDELLDKQIQLEKKIKELNNILFKTVTSNSIPTPQESKVMKNDKVIAPGMFRINPFKTFREEKHVPNNVRASARTKPITVSQPPVIIKKDVNSDSNGLSSTGIDNTKTRRPQPRSNTKN
nr:hypothetical protein [Tanacetum cinerariifolium]